MFDFANDQTQVVDAPLHRVHGGPEDDNYAVDEQQDEDGRDQLLVLERFVFDQTGAAVREDAMDAVRFREDGPEGQRESGREQIHASLQDKFRRRITSELSEGAINLLDNVNCAQLVSDELALYAPKKPPA